MSGGAANGEGETLHYRYRLLRRMLGANSGLLERMVDLVDDLRHLEPHRPAVRCAAFALLDGSLRLAEELNALTAGGDRGLYDAHRQVEAAVRDALRSRVGEPPPLVLPLTGIGRGERELVGGKAAHLGELRRRHPELVPPGFVLTTRAYRRVLEANGLPERLRELLRDLSLLAGRELFVERLTAAREAVTSAMLPEDVERALAAGLAGLGDCGRLAVRSSAVGEDGALSFAGQFESVLQVAPGETADAYRDVLASRFAERAVLYRLAGGFTEVETPMAVLVQPMVPARAAGVLYTRDPRSPDASWMLAAAVPGLGEGLVRGDVPGAMALLTREPAGELVRVAGERAPTDGGAAVHALLGSEGLARLAAAGLAAEASLEGPQDIEWVLTPDGRVVLVQARPLALEPTAAVVAIPTIEAGPLHQGGTTLCPGRTAGSVYVALGTDDLAGTPDGAVLVVAHATPEVATVLRRIAGLIAETGNPAGHAATLLREFGIPALAGVTGATERFRDGQAVSLDAGERTVYPETLWPGRRDRRGDRVEHRRGGDRGGVLRDRVITLNLVDPSARAFRPAGCRSVHDIVRYTHERAVAALFALGDAAAREGTGAVYRLETPLPLHLEVLDLGGAVPSGVGRKHRVAPGDIVSKPFTAFWRGASDPRVSWAGRSQVNLGGFASVVSTAMTGSARGPRELGGRNYVIVAPDYLNLNARLAYHFAMIDALVLEQTEANVVNFRFRGGGASMERRDLRARFLADVLRGARFGVDRRGDLVTAWMRGRPQADCAEGLALLGRLMACARQLDMMVSDEAAVSELVERFLAEDYEAFT